MSASRWDGVFDCPRFDDVPAVAVEVDQNSIQVVS
jgi:hypothetical protein